MIDDLICAECGCTFSFHRRKKLCGPECAKTRASRQFRGWMREHWHLKKEYNAQHRRNVKERKAAAAKSALQINEESS